MKSATSNEISKQLKENFIPSIDFKTRKWEFTKKQKDIISKCCNERSNIIFLEGPAGSSKTLLAIYSALLAIKKGSQRDVLYIRTITESASKQMGALPGDVREKLNPFTIPLTEKLDELLECHSIKILEDKEIVQAIPVNYVRGSSWTNKFIIVDEMQNFDRKEIVTVLTRIGENCTIICCGDPQQSDINGRSGFSQILNSFDTEEARDNYIFCFKLNESDIHRSEILKFIVKTLGV